jgi:hypothetical protein
VFETGWPCLWCVEILRNKAHFCCKKCEGNFMVSGLANHVPNVIEYIVSDEKEPILAIKE